MKHYLEALLLSAIAVFAPVQTVMLTALVLIFADLVAGILAAKKQGEAITSAGLRRTTTKILVYEAALMLGFLTEAYLLNGELPVAKLIGGMIGCTEIKSILESLDIINGKPVFASIIERLGSDNDRPRDRQ